jgi:histidyl-tRNA synthetase
MDHEGRGLKSQMKRADKLGARLVAIMGEDELKEARWTIRDMKTGDQEEIGLDAAAEYLIKETTVG